MGETSDTPFGELPVALINDVLRRTEDLSQKLLANFQQVHTHREVWRGNLKQAGLLGRDAELPHPSIPTSCGVDGSYAVERLLANDLVAAAAVAVEGLTPPSETRYWPEPRHRVWVETEPHETEISTILRALMIGMELTLASEAPHEVVFLDGSLTTPFIYFNQALNKSSPTSQLETATYFLENIVSFLETYLTILTAARNDRYWLALPKYTTRREIGQRMGWPEIYDDRALLTFLLNPGEFTRPITLQQPAEPWHLNLEPLGETSKDKETAARIVKQIISLLDTIRIVYYRPSPGLPALRIEMSRTVAENPARLATALYGVRYQCSAPAVMEPYPLYMADRMVKHLSKAIPTFRQVTSQQVTETYPGSIEEIFWGLHGYRTESGA